jgi:hypothetical protein
MTPDEIKKEIKKVRHEFNAWLEECEAEYGKDFSLYFEEYSVGWSSALDRLEKKLCNQALTSKSS